MRKENANDMIYFIEDTGSARVKHESGSVYRRNQEEGEEYEREMHGVQQALLISSLLLAPRTQYKENFQKSFPFALAVRKSAQGKKLLHL